MFTTLVIIIFSMLAAIGITGWFGIQFTAPSASAPTVILTLAVTHSIHVMISVIHGMHSGLSRYAAIAETTKINLYPITLAALTNVIGFLSMNFSEVPPF